MVKVWFLFDSNRPYSMTGHDIDYPMNFNGTIAKISFADQPSLEALEKGADAMLAEVEQHYRMDCPADMPSDHC